MTLILQCQSCEIIILLQNHPFNLVKNIGHFINHFFIFDVVKSFFVIWIILLNQQWCLNLRFINHEYLIPDLRILFH